MQVPILSGIYTNTDSDFRLSYPYNMVPVPVAQGISEGYLRPSEGLIAYEQELPGLPRAGINWNDVCYRVAGSNLVKVDETGAHSIIGNVGDNGKTATLDYSFDYLGIASNGNLFLYDGGASFQQITDPDLGTVLDFIWVDGYFMTTDGANLVVTELNDPFSVNPLKYGSSEIDPDPIRALLKIKNEPYALNRYTIEVFDNIGGTGFPFQRIDGAQIQRGTVGTHSCCKFLDSVAFVGGGRNESISVWLATGGNSFRIATREIDKILDGYTEEVLAEILVEPRVHQGHQYIYIHLPDRTLVYDSAATQLVGEPVWFVLGSGVPGPNGNPSEYRARHFVWCYNDWLVCDTQTFDHGLVSDSVSSHWGESIGWSFSTPIMYNEGRGAIFHRIELVSLTGRAKFGFDGSISTEYSLDGETWSTPKFVKAGKRGNREKRLVWLQQGAMQHWRIQRFTGSSESHLATARLEIQLEPLTV